MARVIGDDGAPLPLDAIGEIVVSGPRVMPGIAKTRQRRVLRFPTAGIAPAISGVATPMAISPSPGARRR
jgi:hypothetical protein